MPTENLYNTTDQPQPRDRAGRLIEGRTSAYCDTSAPAVVAAIAAGRLIRLPTSSPQLAKLNRAARRTTPKNEES